MHIPAGIHPPVIELDALLQVAVDEHDLVGLVGLDHLVVLARAGGKQLWLGKLAAGLGHGVGHHPAAPDVLGGDPVALSRIAARSADCGLPRRAAA